MSDVYEAELVVERREFAADGRARPHPAPPDGRAAARLGARRPRRPGPRPGPGAAVLAVRRPGRPDRLADRRAARAGRARRIRPCARAGEAGRQVAGARSAQPLRAAPGAALPLHRGRHRHHPDPADAGGGRGGGRRVAPAVRRPHPRLHGLHRRAGGATATGSPSRPQDEAGLLDLGSVLDALPEDALVYCCGPGPLLDAVEERCPAGGAARRAVPGRRSNRPRRDGGVRGRAGAERPYADRRRRACPCWTPCARRASRCSPPAPRAPAAPARPTCSTAMPDHRDSVLTAEEREAGETMMICVSRCRGKNWCSTCDPPDADAPGGVSPRRSGPR